MTILPRLRTTFGEDIGVEVFFGFPEIQKEAKTYLDADSAIGATSLTANGVDFSNNQYVVIGNPGSEKTEIVQVSGTPTGTTILLAAGTSFAHNRGDVIRFIPFNQIAAEMATDGATFSIVSTFNIRPDATESYLQRPTDLGTYSYRFRFYNSTSANYSGYSSVELGSGFGDNTIYSVKKRALAQLGETLGDLITNEFLTDCIREARRICDQNPAVLRWSFRTKFNAVVGQALAGQWTMTAPSDLRDQNTFKNVLSLRFGNQNRPMYYQDKRRFNQNYLNVRHSTTSGSTASGSTTLVLASTHDLDAPTSGTSSATIANNSVGDGLINITYTGNNKTTNTLSGIPASGTGSINRTIATGTDVWQQATFGIWSNFTVDAATFRFDTPLPVAYDGQDLKIDYYSQIPSIVNDADTFDEPFYDMYVPYVKWKIKYLKANGKIDRDSDPDWKDWVAGLTELITQEVGGQMVNFVPDVSGFLSGTDG